MVNSDSSEQLVTVCQDRREMIVIVIFLKTFVSELAVKVGCYV